MSICESNDDGSSPKKIKLNNIKYRLSRLILEYN